MHRTHRSFWTFGSSSLKRDQIAGMMTFSIRKRHVPKKRNEATTVWPIRSSGHVSDGMPVRRIRLVKAVREGSAATDVGGD